jgi:hypothetical protein
MGDIVAQQLEALVVEEVVNMVPRPGEEVIHAEHLAPKLQQSFTQVRAEESCATGNENSSF